MRALRQEVHGEGGQPNCLCGLIPMPNGHRRQGLWQKDASALAKLGPDPSADKREVLYQNMAAL